MQLRDLLESTPPETGIITLWHGGKDVQSDYLEVKAHGKGRWEYGPGLYLTNDRATAVRYAKGGRKLYNVTVNLTGAREIEDVEIPLHEAIAFVERHVIARLRRNVIADLNTAFTRRGKLPADVLVNLCLNWEAIQNSKTNILRQFLIDHGVDYSFHQGYGGQREVAIYVVINPRIIQNVIPTRG